MITTVTNQKFTAPRRVLATLTSQRHADQIANRHDHMFVLGRDLAAGRVISDDPHHLLVGFVLLRHRRVVHTTPSFFFRRYFSSACFFAHHDQYIVRSNRSWCGQYSSNRKTIHGTAMQAAMKNRTANENPKPISFSTSPKLTVPLTARRLRYRYAIPPLRRSLPTEH